MLIMKSFFTKNKCDTFYYVYVLHVLTLHSFVSMWYSIPVAVQSACRVTTNHMTDNYEIRIMSLAIMWWDLGSGTDQSEWNYTRNTRLVHNNTIQNHFYSLCIRRNLGPELQHITTQRRHLYVLHMRVADVFELYRRTDVQMNPYAYLCFWQRNLGRDWCERNSWTCRE